MINKFADFGGTMTLDPAAADVPDAVVEDLAKVFKLLSDETRLRILLYLTRNDELHVRALCEILAQSQPAVSHHLALLRVAKLIECRREGKHNYYRLRPQRFQELLEVLFAAVPQDERGIHFEDYVLSH
jgi:ArsR family transcriptional regulator